jgi:hypothetical protein
MKIQSYLFVILTVSILNIKANTIHVPANIDSIQGGIDMAVEGDTVLVQPGTYYENINFNGKNIVVGSLTLTTGDTSYISQTVIDGDSSGSVVTFENGEDSTAILYGFLVTHGSGSGGGMFIFNSSPTVNYVNVASNIAPCDSYWHTCPRGGGIYIENSNAIILNSNISQNSSQSGGGIFCIDSSPFFKNVTICENLAHHCGGSPGISGGPGMGGGVFLERCSNTKFEDVLIKENIAEAIGRGVITDYGSGVFINNSSANISNVIIANNFGSGIKFKFWDDDSSTVNLSNVTVKYNDNHGIVIGNRTILNFDTINRCNIYNNIVYNIHNIADSLGCDLYSNTDSIITVIVDTFTILNPDSTHAFPLDKFTFDILNDTTGIAAKIENEKLIPLLFNLKQNYPNPFNPSTKIKYTIPKPLKVKIEIFNLLGQKISTLLNKQISAGSHEVGFTAKDLSSGVYLYRIESGEYQEVRKMILLR